MRHEKVFPDHFSIQTDIRLPLGFTNYKFVFLFEYVTEINVDVSYTKYVTIMLLSSGK